MIAVYPRSFFTLLILCLANTVNCHSFFQSPGVKICNDSAAFFLESGQAAKARRWLDQASITTGHADKDERARSFLLWGDFYTEAGYAEKALAAFRKSRALTVNGNRKINALAATGIAANLNTLSRYDSVLYYTDQSKMV